MIPSRTLINALRTSADQIAFGTKRYAWHERHNCNCGVLAQNLLGIGAYELKDRITDSLNRSLGNRNDTWAEMAKVCPTTGLPVADIIVTLMDYGLEPEDFEAIEFLDHDMKACFSTPSFVADWMRKKATELESQLVPEPVKPKQKEPVTIGVTLV